MLSHNGWLDIYLAELTRRAIFRNSNTILAIFYYSTKISPSAKKLTFSCLLFFFLCCRDVKNLCWVPQSIIKVKTMFSKINLICSELCYWNSYMYKVHLKFIIVIMNFHISILKIPGGINKEAITSTCNAIRW